MFSYIQTKYYNCPYTYNQHQIHRPQLHNCRMVFGTPTRVQCICQVHQFWSTPVLLVHRWLKGSPSSPCQRRSCSCSPSAAAVKACCFLLTKFYSLEIQKCSNSKLSELILVSSKFYSLEIWKCSKSKLSKLILVSSKFYSLRWKPNNILSQKQSID